MPLPDTITDIISKLRQGRFSNEQSISQGIVLRLLQELGWDVYDTAIVWPEFQTGEGRVDFALCHPPSKPSVFIEVKQPGKAEDGVRQALEYAFHTGVPFVILTDGKTWSFYLPAEQGTYEERRVYKLDLFERTPDQASETLVRYASRNRVESGEALETARKEYRSRNRRSIAKQAIPTSWNELLEKGDELMVELLADAVESKVGVRPEIDDISDFFAALTQQTKNPPSSTPLQQNSSSGTPSPVPAKIPTTPSNRFGTLTIQGKDFPYSNAKDAMVKILTILSETDQSFLQRCSQHPDCRGKKRRYIARTPEELYPGRSDLVQYNEAIPDGWYVATNLSNQIKLSIVKAATQVAGLTFGTDVSVEF